MDAALCSILCNEKSWSHAIPYAVYIKFNSDGTGELWAVGDIGVFIFACNFVWKSIEIPNQVDPLTETPATTTSFWTQKPQVLGRLQLEMTLEKSMAKRFVEVMPTYRFTNEKNLTELAFQTRIFDVTIEKGNFMPEWYVGQGTDYHRYGLRLRFDESPYPPLEAYKDNGGYGPDLEWWSTRLRASSTFLARGLPDSARKTRAMNDDSGYRIGCVGS